MRWHGTARRDRTTVPTGTKRATGRAPTQDLSIGEEGYRRVTTGALEGVELLAACPSIQSPPLGAQVARITGIEAADCAEQGKPALRVVVNAGAEANGGRVL